MVLFCFLFFLCGFCLFVFSGFSYFSSCSTCFGLSNITVILSIGFVGNLSGDASHCFGAWLSVSRWGIQSCFGVFSLEALSVKISFLMDTCVGVSSISSCFSVQVGSPHLTQNEKCPHMVSGMLIFFSASGIPSLCTWNKAPILDWEFVLVIFASSLLVWDQISCFISSCVGIAPCFCQHSFLAALVSLPSWPNHAAFHLPAGDPAIISCRLDGAARSMAGTMGHKYMPNFLAFWIYVVSGLICFTPCRRSCSTSLIWKTLWLFDRGPIMHAHICLKLTCVLKLARVVTFQHDFKKFI